MWCADAEQEHVCEETGEEVILIKDAAGGLLFGLPAPPLGRATPVLHREAGNAHPVVEIRRDQHSVGRQGVCCDRGIEVFDPLPFSLQDGLHLTELLADHIRPRCPCDLCTNQIKPITKSLAALGTGKALDSICELRQNWLRDAQIALTDLADALEQPRLALHQGRDGIRVEHVLHRRRAGLDVRARRMVRSNSSTARRAVGSGWLNLSKNPGDHSELCVSSRSSARTINRLRLIWSARARLSTASSRPLGR